MPGLQEAQRIFPPGAVLTREDQDFIDVVSAAASMVEGAFTSSVQSRTQAKVESIHTRTRLALAADHAAVEALQLTFVARTTGTHRLVST